MTVKAYLNPGIKSLNLSISSPTDTYSGRTRNDLATVKVWCATVSGFDVTTLSPFSGDPPSLERNLVYDGLSLQVHIANLVPNTQYYVKYALVSNIDPSPLGYTVFGELTSFVYENPTDGEFLLAGDGDGGFQNVALGPGLGLDNNVLTTFGLAKTTESFVVMEYSGQMLNERKLTQGTGIKITDDGPNNKVTISLGGLGALTSVGLAAADDFFLSISNSPLEANGLIGLGYKEGRAIPVTSGGTGRTNLGTGVLMANNTGSVRTGVAGVDYQGPTSGADVLMGNGTGGIKNVSIGSFLNFQNGVLSVDFTFPSAGSGGTSNTGGTTSTGNNTSISSLSSLSSLISTLFPVLNNGIANTYPILNTGTKDKPNIALVPRLPIEYGGTGANTAPEAIRNLLPATPGPGSTGWVLTLGPNGTDSQWERPYIPKNAIAQMKATAPLVIDYYDITLFDPGVAGGRGANISLTGTMSIAQGGTGASNVVEARKSLLPSYSTKGTKFLRINREETDLEWADPYIPQLNSEGYVLGAANQGRIDGEPDGKKEPANILTLRSAYNNNNYPAVYGNVLTLGGEGGNEIFVGWPGAGGVSGEATQHANAYIRSRRDISNNWSPWTPIVTKANYQNLGMFSIVAVTGSYTDLINKPTFANVAFTADYTHLVNRPAFANVALTGSYTDLINKPNIPTRLSNLADVNTSGVTASQILIYNASVGIWRPGNASSLTSGFSANANFAETANSVIQVVGIDKGGTGKSNRQDALNALTNGAPLNKILRGDGTNAVWGSIVSADLNGFNISANLNGTADYAKIAYNIAGNTVIAVINGGTGKNNRQDAINELTNNDKTTGNVLRIDATGNAKMDSIKATDLAGLTIGANVTGSAGTVTTTVGISLGGTGQVTRQAAINFLASSNAINITTGGGGGRYLKSTDGINMVMANISASEIPQLNQNTTGSAGSLISTYILPAIQGGTGQGGHTAFTVGDILYASSPNTLSKLAAVPAGNVLLSRGAGMAPAYGKLDLSTMATGTAPGSGGSVDLAGTGVTGFLPVGKGGTGRDTLTSGALLKGNGSAIVRDAVSGQDYAPPTSGANLLAGNGAGGFTQVGLSGPLSYNAGTLTSTAISNALSYVWPAQQTFNKALFSGATEAVVISTTASSTITLNATTASVLYTTKNPTASWTLNVSGVSTLLTQNGQSLTVVHMVLNGATAYYQAEFQIDGTTHTPKWFNASAPTSGNANSIDVYTFTIIRTASGVYTTLATLARYG